MKRLIFVGFLFFFWNVYAQLPGGSGGSVYIVNSARNVGQGLKNARQEQDRNREREEQEYRYTDLVTRADTAFAHQAWTEAIGLYEQALRIREARYPRLRMEEATAILNRRNGDAFQQHFDSADSLLAILEFDSAIAGYSEALKLRDHDYPRKRIQEATTAKSYFTKVHFSGLLVADVRADERSSQAGSNDPWSDFLDAGSFPWMDQALTFANFAKLDGIAVPAGMQLVVYGERNYRGNVLLDVTGPAIIENVGHPEAQSVVSKTFEVPVLQKTFPPEVRQISKTNMHAWVNGSMIIRELP